MNSRSSHHRRQDVCATNGRPTVSDEASVLHAAEAGQARRRRDLRLDGFDRKVPGAWRSKPSSRESTASLGRGRPAGLPPTFSRSLRSDSVRLRASVSLWFICDGFVCDVFVSSSLRGCDVAMESACICVICGFSSRWPCAPCALAVQYSMPPRS